eukprot:TRINITY_DN20164_c0_g1_i1.p1 TRINITY_DN20164_c0_g1~~TRINITY_DN20164_c0_g1_i1.p1  ORF type:complete len:564 (-),score=86.41 TRINITY_DN20164_c0_g1_i1:21-1481(-)
MRNAAIDGTSLKMARKQRHWRNLKQELETSGSFRRLKVIDFLDNAMFDAGMGVVILANSVLIGIESNFDLQGRDLTIFEFLGHLFLAIYFVELGLRWFALRMECFRSAWIKFDMVLVFLVVLTSWVMAPIVAIVRLAVGQADDPSGALEFLMVLKILRLFRLARAVRLLVQFKTLWMLVRGLLCSASTIFFTCVLMVLALYIFACLCVELISRPYQNGDDAEMSALVRKYFPNLEVSMLTLLRFVFFDNTFEIYEPMLMRNPWLAILFALFLLIVSIAMMNLVTAVIVEGAIEQGKQDKEVEQEHKKQLIKSMIPALTAMFYEMDEDGNGTLTFEELQRCGDDLQDELMMNMKAESLEELFDMIDVDGSGEVEIDEFCIGVSKIASSDQPVEFIRILKQLHGLSLAVEKQNRCVDSMGKQFSYTCKRIERRIEQQAELVQAALAKQEAAINSIGDQVTVSQRSLEHRLERIEQAIMNMSGSSHRVA